MRIPWELVLAFGAGLALLYLIGSLLLAPKRFLWRVMAGSVLGGLALWALNQLSGWTGFTVAVNPFTALLTGLLGLPGIGLIFALEQLVL